MISPPPQIIPLDLSPSSPRCILSINCFVIKSQRMLLKRGINSGLSSGGGGGGASVTNLIFAPNKDACSNCPNKGKGIRKLDRPTQTLERSFVGISEGRSCHSFKGKKRSCEREIKSVTVTLRRVGSLFPTPTSHRCPSERPPVPLIHARPEKTR